MAQRYEIQQAVEANAAGRLTPVSAASVAVNDLRGTALTVYAAETGATTVANPLATDTNGQIEGWVEAPDFDLVVARGASPVSFNSYTARVRQSPVGIFNVKSYGAKGDGVADDTSAIQAAIAAGVATGIGATVYLRNGTYLISGTLSLSNSVSLIGENRQTTTIKLKDGTNAATDLISTPLLTGYLFHRIERLQLDGNKANNPTGGSGITGSFGQSEFRDLWIKNCHVHGIKQTPSVQQTLNRLDRVLITNNDGHGAYFTNNADFWIEDSWFGGSSQAVVPGPFGNEPGAGLRVESCGDVYIDSILIDTCVRGLHISNTSALRMANYNIGNCSGHNALMEVVVNIQTGVGTLTADGITGAGVDGIKVDSVGGNTIDQVEIGPLTVRANIGGHSLNYAVNITGGGTFKHVRVAPPNIGDSAVSQAIPVNLPAVSVASATTVTLPNESDVITVSGTTTITSVSTSWVGRRVTLIFSGALTFTDGSNLKLASNFVTTADDTISLVCDGTNWFEVGRSVN